MKENKNAFLFFFLVFAVATFGLLATNAARAQSVGVTLPTTPTGVTATALPPSQATISWGASTESSGTIEDYSVYRNGALISTTAGTSIIDSGLTPGVYIYTVTAIDANNNVSPQSAPVNLSMVADTTPPSTPTDIAVTGTTSTNSAYTPTTLTISWTASTDNVGVAGYNVYRNGIKITTSTTALTGTSINDTVLPGAYSYTVGAYDASQNFSEQSAPVLVVVSTDNTPPSVPADISAQQISATGITLAWASSTGSIGVAGYQVFRNGIQIASATTPTYTDSGLSAGSSYAYALTSYDVAGNISARSTPITATLQYANGPSVPYITSATFLSTSTVRIAWSPSGDVLPITSYTIYRNDAQAATVTSTGTSYLDEGLATGTYMYNISATDITGAVSETSSPVSVIVPVVSTSTMAAATALPTSPAPIVTPAVTPPSTPTFSFTQFLYLGLRGSQVQALQSFLVQNGYLTANATGYFGSLTQAALEKFQCDKNVVCTGGAGWGTVGPKTRAALNATSGTGTGVDITTNAPTQSSLAAELQTLEAELAALEKGE